MKRRLVNVLFALYAIALIALYAWAMLWLAGLVDQQPCDPRPGWHPDMQGCR